MSQGPIGVGIVGLSAERGWGATAHLPAIAANPDLALVASCGSTPERGAAAAAKFGVPRAPRDHLELVALPEVELVVVTVRVPMHAELVGAAIDAGKAVLCEWPLARDVAEAEALSDRAEAAGVRGFVGLQARSTPPLLLVADLLAAGRIGEVLSTTLIGGGDRWGATVPPAVTYLLDRDNGATMLTIPVAHTLDGVFSCLGEAAELSATTATRRPLVEVEDTGEELPMSAEDQIAVDGRLAGGAVLSLHYRGGRSPSTGFLWEIEGSEGTIALRGDSGHLQYGKVSVGIAAAGEREMTPLEVPGEYLLTELDPGSLPFAVGQEYAMIARDLRRGTGAAASFADAVARHRTVAAIEAAAATGARQSL